MPVIRQGSDAAFFYARDNGYFKEEGLNVVIDRARAPARR
jgi:ABC-type nitrate/sulfonate/bicarbonate transport system substrate-binding protein